MPGLTRNFSTIDKSQNKLLYFTSQFFTVPYILLKIYLLTFVRLFYCGKSDLSVLIPCLEFPEQGSIVYLMDTSE